MMHIEYDAGGEIAAENGKIHYSGEKTGLLIVDEGISFLDLLSLVKRACGTETKGPVLLMRARSDDAKGFRALLHNSPASMASPPPRRTGTGTPLFLKYVPTNFQKEEYLPTNDTTASAAAEMASMVTPTAHLQLSEFQASENHMAVPKSSETPLLLENSTANSSINPPLDLQPVVLETSENHQSIPTSSGTPVLLSASGSSRNHNASDAMKELNEKQAKIQKPKLVNKEWISSLAMSLMERDLPCEELDIMEQISDQYGYDVDFSVVWKSRILAIKKLGLLEDNEEIVKKLKEKKKKGEKPMVVPSIDRRKDDASVEVITELKEITQASRYIFTTKKPKLVDMKWISSLAKSLMQRDLPCTEKYIVDEINKEFGYDVDFNLAWKSRNLALKQLGLVKDDDKVKFDWEEIKKKKVGKRVPDMYDDDEFDDDLTLQQPGLVKDDDKVKFDWEEIKKKKVGRRLPDMFDDDEFDDEFDDESDDEFDAYGGVDDDQERKKKENTKVVQAGNSGKKGGYRAGDVQGMSRMTDATAMGYSPYMVNMPFTGMNSNLQNGLNLPPQSFGDLNTSEPEKAVSGSSSSDISGLQKGLSEIRAFLEEFRRIIMILLTVILLFLLLHHQTGKR